MLRLIRLSALATVGLANENEQDTLLQMRSRVGEDCSKGGCEPGPPRPTARPTLPPLDPLECYLIGDPHIKTFDRQKVDQHVYGAFGDYYLVDTDKLKIQARYCAHGNGKAVVQGLAISGKAVFDQEVYVPAWGGHVDQDGIYVNNNLVIGCKLAKDCENSKFSHAGLNVSYGQGLEVRNKLKGKVVKKSNTVVIRAPGVEVELNQGTHQNIGMAIHPYYLDGTSGHCGNADGDLDNDVFGKDKMNNAGPSVPESERLFPDANPCDGVVQVDKECPNMVDFQTQCLAEFKGRADEVDECVVDCCDAEGVFPECPVGTAVIDDDEDACQDDHDPKFSAYWEFGNCGHFGNDHNKDWCGGVHKGECALEVDLTDLKGVNGESAAEWFQCPSMTAVLVSMKKSQTFVEGVLDRKKAFTLSNCPNGDCLYIWHAQYKCKLGTPNADFMAYDTKCAWKSEERVFRLTGKSLTDCADECEAHKECKFFSHGAEPDIAAHRDVCMGCKTATFQPHDGFVAYKLKQLTIGEVINLEQEPGAKVILGDSKVWRAGIKPELTINNDHSPGAWVATPNGDLNTCSDSIHLVVDLGKMGQLTGVTLWHYYGNTRQYCNQGVAISETGEFNGEETVVYSTGTDYGPTEVAGGNHVTFASMKGRYVKHWCGRSTSNTGIHFMEIDVYGYLLKQ